MNSLPDPEVTLDDAAMPLSVIVADDVEEIRRIIGHWLEEAGHSVAYASTGNEVVRLITEHAFDVVVADVLMPDGDGLEVILAAHRVRPAPRVLAISGGGKYMTGEDCLRVAKGIGADYVLLKPFTREQLLAAVTAVAGQGGPPGRSDPA